MLAVVTIGATSSLTPASCQGQYTDQTLSGPWAQVTPAPARGAGGTATVTKKTVLNIESHYQVDLMVKAGGSGTSSIAAVMIDSSASYTPSVGPLASFLYSESTIYFSGANQLFGPALRQNGKIYVL
jgi:hypothetical protein